MSKPEIEALLERVKAATGREIALEREIMCTIGGWHRLSPLQHPRNHKHPMFVDTREGYSSHEGQTLYRDVPRIMESIDAALALVERKLPGWWWLREDGQSIRLVGPDNGDCYPSAVGRHHLVPLAILAALLTALEAQP